jgi:hypothetical protein
VKHHTNKTTPYTRSPSYSCLYNEDISDPKQQKHSKRYLWSHVRVSLQRRRKVVEAAKLILVAFLFPLQAIHPDPLRLQCVALWVISSWQGQWIVSILTVLVSRSSDLGVGENVRVSVCVYESVCA